MRWLVVLWVLVPDVARASDPIPVRLTACVLDGVAITLDGYPIKISGQRPIDLAPYAGKKIRVTGDLTPGDRLAVTAGIEDLGPCSPDEKLALLHALADIYRSQGDAIRPPTSAPAKKQPAMDCTARTCYRILRVPKAGGTATILRSANLVGHIFVDKDSVYWTEGDVRSWQIMKLRKRGGTPTPIAKGDLRGDMVHGRDGFYGYIDGGLVALAEGKPTRTLVPVPIGSEVAVDDANVYFAEYGPENSSSISAMPLAGGTKRPLAVGEPNSNALIVADGQLYWANINVPPLGGGQIRRVSVDGGVVRTIVDTLPRMLPWAMTVDARTIYWVETTGTGFAVYRAPKDGGTRTLVAVAPASFMHRDNRNRIAVDDKYVYWNAQETVARAPKAGGPVEDVVRLARGDVMSFAMDDKDVYAAVVIF